MRKTKNETLLDLLNFPIFKNLSKEDIRIIKQNQKIVSFKKGETILKQGSSAENLICIVSGLTKWYIELKNKEFIIQLFKATEIVGFQASLINSTYFYSLAAIEPSLICFIDKKIFQIIIKRNLHFNTDFISYLAIKGSFIIQRTISIAHKQMNGKIADVILYLHHEIYNSATSFPFLLSRQELADMAAISKESAIRILKEFKESGIINMNGQNIKILQYNKLKEISEFG